MSTLIFFDKNDLKPVGGPSGYLYNLENGITELNRQEEVEFLDFHQSHGRNIVARIKKMPSPVAHEIIDIHCLLSMKKLLWQEKYFDFSRYQVVHFHSTLTMYHYKKCLRNYRGKVILTSHCPKAQHKEIIEDTISKRFYNRHRIFFDALSQVDKYCFDHADYITFPCEEALEPYFESWMDFSNIYAKNKDKFVYIPTGIKKVQVQISRIHIRKEYRIPDDAKVICFVGRHNATKGYDTLIELHNRCKDYYFFIAGSNDGIDYPHDDHWIEVGWTDDPYSVINAADIYVLANKQTYFDLSLLEVLSLNVPVLLSRTGGNKYFERFNSKGIQFFSDVDDAVNKLKQFFELEPTELKHRKNEIKQIYEENFTCSEFALKYLSLLEKIYKDEK